MNSVYEIGGREWRDILGYRGLYVISRDGYVARVGKYGDMGLMLGTVDRKTLRYGLVMGGIRRQATLHEIYEWTFGERLDIDIDERLSERESWPPSHIELSEIINEATIKRIPRAIPACPTIIRKKKQQSIRQMYAELEERYPRQKTPVIPKGVDEGIKRRAHGEPFVSVGDYIGLVPFKYIPYRRGYFVYTGHKDGELMYIGTTMRIADERFTQHRLEGMDLDFRVIASLDNADDMWDLEHELIQHFKPTLNKNKEYRQGLPICGGLLDRPKDLDLNTTWCPFCGHTGQRIIYGYCDYCGHKIKGWEMKCDDDE